jgi:hypothetical protein
MSTPGPGMTFPPWGPTGEWLMRTQLAATLTTLLALAGIPALALGGDATPPPQGLPSEAVPATQAVAPVRPDWSPFSGGESE